MKLNEDIFLNDIDLRKELDILLRDYGYDVVLVNAGSMSCSCTDGQGQQANSLCPLCMGIGRKIELSKIKVISKAAQQTIKVPNSSEYGALGSVYSNAKTFYIKYHVAPPIGSYVLEVSWRNNKPLNIIGAYEIEYSEPYRMDRGRQEYFLTSGHRDPANIPLKEQILRKLYK